MRVPVQIISFLSFLFCASVVLGQEITCDLKSNTYGVKEIIPEGKTIFRAGESVKITCKDTHWFYGTKKTIKTFTCQDNGKWDSEPVCEDIRCEVPHGQNVYNLNYFNYGEWRLRLGAKKYYTCTWGYEKMAEEAECTRDGWTPKPLCAESIQVPPYSRAHRRDNSVPVCEANRKPCVLSLENGVMYRRSSNEEEIFYTCNTGYKAFSGNWWDSVTCSKGSWSEKPQCIREEECGALPSVPHGKIKKTRLGTLEVECDPGFTPSQSFINCNNGAWEKPVCEVGVRCDIPPKVENAFITSKPEEFYVDGSSVTYECGSSYLIIGKSTVSCLSETWEKVPTCVGVSCPLNTTAEDLKMERFPDIVGPAKPGHRLMFSCDGQGLKLKGQEEITCQPNGEWSDPFPKCEEVKCVAKLTVNMRSDVTEAGHTGNEVSVRFGQTITLSCAGEGTELRGQEKLTCLSNGEWNVPFPKCLGGKCGPPPNVNFADTIEITKNEYNSGDRVEYMCFDKYKLVKDRPYSKYLTCENGEWRGNVKCLKPCSVSVEDFDKRGVELIRGGRQKIFAPHEDYITFICQRGKYTEDRDLRRKCNDGVIDLPLCE